MKESKFTRRQFLKTAGALTGGVLAVANSKRAYAAQALVPAAGVENPTFAFS